MDEIIVNSRPRPRRPSFVQLRRQQQHLRYQSQTLILTLVVHLHKGKD